MTKLLEKAFAEASKLPQEDQDSFAAMLLAELASERRWTEAFAKFHEKLSALAEEALSEFKERKTHPLSDDL